MDTVLWMFFFIAALDVKKQKDLSGFYRHLLNQTVGEEAVPDRSANMSVSSQQYPLVDISSIQSCKTTIIVSVLPQQKSVVECFKRHREDFARSIA